jgi:hypothetical protein
MKYSDEPMSHSRQPAKAPQTGSPARGQSRGGVALDPPRYGVEMVDAVVQRKLAGEAVEDPVKVREAAKSGIRGPGGPLPYFDRLQQAFGDHDLGGVVSHRGPEAEAGARAMGARAFATGNHIAFAAPPSLHTVAHEVAHVVQQRAGVQLRGGVGQAGDAYERQADAVADAVVTGGTVAGLLGSRAQGEAASGESIQRESQPISISPGSTGPSAYALRASGIPELYWRFIFPGGTVYRRTNTNPLTVFDRGWTRVGYDDLVRHTDTDQGAGSNWIATTEDLAGMDENYGAYAFEIDLQWHQGVLVNPAYQTLTGHRNPHAQQQEVAVYGTVEPGQIVAVWVPKKKDEIKPTQLGPVFADYYERYTREAYISKFKTD